MNQYALLCFTCHVLPRRVLSRTGAWSTLWVWAAVAELHSEREVQLGVSFSCIESYIELPHATTMGLYVPEAACARVRNARRA